MKNVIDVFKSVAVEVITQMTHLKINHGAVGVRTNSYPSFEYAFIIGITGDYRGMITMSMSEKTAFFVVSAMMKMPVTKFDEMAESALRELANMTVAKAFTKISEDGGIDITPPIFIKGREVSLAVDNTQKTYVLTLDTEGGDLELLISLKNNKDR